MALRGSSGCVAWGRSRRSTVLEPGLLRFSAGFPLPRRLFALRGSACEPHSWGSGPRSQQSSGPSPSRCIEPGRRDPQRARKGLRSLPRAASTDVLPRATPPSRALPRAPTLSRLGPSRPRCGGAKRVRGSVEPFSPAALGEGCPLELARARPWRHPAFLLKRRRPRPALLPGCPASGREACASVSSDAD